MSGGIRLARSFGHDAVKRSELIVAGLARGTTHHDETAASLSDPDSCEIASELVRGR